MPLKVVVGGRREGKTTRLIALLREHPTAVLLTSHADEMRDLRRWYPDLADRILTAREHVMRGRNQDVIVDNAEWLLQQFLGARSIRVVSFTGHAETMHNPYITDRDRQDANG